MKGSRRDFQPKILRFWSFSVAGSREPKGPTREGILLLKRATQAGLPILFVKMNLSEETHFGDLCFPIMGCEDPLETHFGDLGCSSFGAKMRNTFWGHLPLYPGMWGHLLDETHFGDQLHPALTLWLFEEQNPDCNKGMHIQETGDICGKYLANYCVNAMTGIKSCLAFLLSVRFFFGGGDSSNFAFLCTYSLVVCFRFTNEEESVT